MESIDAEAARLAGLLTDLMQKIRHGQVALRHLQWFLGLTREQREQYYNDANAKYVVRIDRTQPFDLVKFLGLGEGWSVEEQDEYALKITELSPSKVLLKAVFSEAETGITGDETRRRLKESGHILLDAQVLAVLLENQEKIPESWEGKDVYFDGTVIRGLGYHSYTLCLSRPSNETKRWTWSLRNLWATRYHHEFSAVLEGA